MRRFLWFAIGVALLGVGLTLAFASPGGRTDFGWFADTPLENSDWTMSITLLSDDSGPYYVVTRQFIVGVAVAGAGLLMIATGVAHALGRRQRGAG